MDYNTQREKLILPEYGRHVQKMMEQVCYIEDKAKRTEQAQAVVNVMNTLNPQLRDYPDSKRKLWDHAHIITDYQLDVDAPYEAPIKEVQQTKPDPIEYSKTPIRMSCYGRNIQNMIGLIVDCEKGEDVRRDLIRLLALYMRQQYLIWNKDNVADETIFKDMELLSEGKLKVPEGIDLGPITGDFSRPGIGNQNGRNLANRKFNKKRRK
ncbi:MAG: DUF4290 domain-containing protein [Bacteroidales bacterium]|jgi:hypothetical protein|nr:DUF4290 domain-containing protein [Bacteroidales bacterium]